MSKISLRFRVDFDGLCSLGFGKIALLEAIVRHGSIVDAARELGMSRRRAMTLVRSMNDSFDQPLVVKSANRGSLAVTEFGTRAIEQLRSFDSLLTPLAQKHLRELASHVRTSRDPKPTITSRSV